MTKLFANDSEQTKLRGVLRRLTGPYTDVPTLSDPMVVTESTQPAALEENLKSANLSRERLRESFSKLETLLERNEKVVSVDMDTARAWLKAREDDAKRAFDKITAAHTDFSQEEEIALEAVIHADGTRPSIEMRDDTIDPEHEKLKDWQVLTEWHRGKIERAAQSVGRIDLLDSQMGSGFVVGEGLVMTNLHVLKRIAKQNPAGSGNWELHDNVTMVFQVGAGTPERFTFSHVVDVGQIPQGNDAMVDYHDYATLACVAPTLPKPLLLSNASKHTLEDAKLFTIGFPESRGSLSRTILHEIFGTRMGVKRYAPGEVSVTAGGLQNPNLKASFSHDASTLGGSSGSLVCRLGNFEGALEEPVVIGVHYGGLNGGDNVALSGVAMKPFWLPANTGALTYVQ